MINWAERNAELAFDEAVQELRDHWAIKRYGGCGLRDLRISIYERAMRGIERVPGDVFSLPSGKAIRQERIETTTSGFDVYLIQSETSDGVRFAIVPTFEDISTPIMFLHMTA